MKPFSEWDFTLQRYELLCRSILDCNYHVFKVRDYLINQKNVTHEPIIVLRHDVDRKPFHALRMAQVEDGLGIKATYYFRVKSPSFQPEVIKKIAHLGHEIGYHYENLSDMHGNMESAIKDFEKKLKKIRELVPISTICMHGSPLSRWNNRDLWEKYDYKDFGLIGEPYLSIDYSKIIYLTDTGRTWKGGLFNVRDRVNSKVRLEINSTLNLINTLKSKSHGQFLIQCHPERWSSNIFQWMRSFSRDYVSNYAKIVISSRRKT